MQLLTYINLDTFDKVILPGNFGLNISNDRQHQGALFGLVLTPCKLSREEISHLSWICKLRSNLFIKASCTECLMLTLLCLLFLLPVEHRVSASSGLLSWQLDTNNRSTWDIVWSCSSTIFACTWTIIHSDVPGRQVSEARQQLMCVRTWLIALLVPELILGFAFLELFNVINSKARYNVVQAEAKSRRQARSGSHGGLRNEPFDGVLENPNAAKWTFAQTFCINAGGLALQTQDDWIYTVTCEDEMVLLIQSGMVSPLDLRERDIQEHAKQDWLGKLFTLLQVSWFICNIITRWASHVSVSPFELATVAYCLLGIVIYGFWWFKPKDMGAPIIVPLHYDRDNIPGDLHDAMHSTGWTHRLAPLKEEHILIIAWDAMKTPFLSDNAGDVELLKERPIETPSWIIHIAVILFGLTSLSYCGIHIAAWVSFVERGTRYI